MKLDRTTLMFDYCWVCGERFKTSTPPGIANREDHHIFPRNAGGEDGPITSLCDSHHGTIHKIANRIHSGKDLKDLLIGEGVEQSKKLCWLAAMIVKAEREYDADPNKKRIQSFKLSAAETLMVERLQKHFQKSRQDIFRASLVALYKATFG